MKKLFRKQMKYLRSLDSKKGRRENKQFIVESIKTVKEIINSDIDVDYLVFDDNFDEVIKNELISAKSKINYYYTDEFERLSTLKNSEGVIAVADIPVQKSKDEFFQNKSSIIGLFDINDPGNLGTIIRTASWYGIEGVIIFGNSTDIFSPKVIRSSMGGIFRTDLLFAEKYEILEDSLKTFTTVGTFIDMESDFVPGGNDKIILLLGNEANGLDDNLKKIIDCNYRIKGKSDLDSLNVSVAAGIIIDKLFGNN